MTDQTPREFAREYIEQHTSPESPWTGKRFVVQQGIKPEHGFAKIDLKGAVDALADEEEILAWHGQIAPLKIPILQAILREENAADVPREILKGKVVRAIKTTRENPDESGDATAATEDGGASA